jgi:hypothetical protein
LPGARRLPVRLRLSGIPDTLAVQHRSLVEATNSDPKRISCLGLVFVATTALISIFNRSWLVGHKSPQPATKNRERNVGAETARLMIKPTRGLWHFCYSE